MHTWASGQSHTKGGRLVVFAAAVNRLTAVLGRLELRWMGGGYRRERERPGSLATHTQASLIHNKASITGPTEMHGPVLALTNLWSGVTNLSAN